MDEKKTTKELIVDRLVDLFTKTAEKVPVLPEKEEPALIEKKEPELKLDAAAITDFAKLVAPAVLEEMKKGLPDTTKEEPEPKSEEEINEAVVKALTEVGIDPNEVDIDLVVRKKRKGLINVKETDIIFKNKHVEIVDDDPENDEIDPVELQLLKEKSSRRKLNKQLSGLSPEDRKKALGLYIYSQVSNR